MYAEPFCACLELYEVSGGDVVDGSPPAPVELQWNRSERNSECRAELVARPDRCGQCDNWDLVFLKFEIYLTIYFVKADFYIEQ